MSAADRPWICTACGREVLASRCGCQGTVADSATATAPVVSPEATRLLRMARVHREAAALHPATAAANIADAERLEALAGGAA